MRLPMNTALDNLQLSGIRRFTAMAKQKPGCVMLTLGEPEFDTSASICEQVVESLQAGETHYPPNNGQEYLLQALSQQAEQQGLHYPPDEIIVTCGATEALFSTFTALLNPGDEVIVPTPAFGLYESIVGLCRGRYVPLNTAPCDFQIDAESLQSVVSEKTKAIVLISPNNPTGCIYNEASLQAVAELAQEKGIYVICDDVYNQLAYTDQFQRFAVCYPDLKENIIVIDSFSKPYAMTGWRLGWLMAEQAVKQQIQKVHQYSVVSVTSFTQKACVTALQSDITAMQQSYQKRRDLVYNRLCEMGMKVNKPEGAFYIFPSIEQYGLSSEEFCTRLIQQAGVATVPGSCFGCEGYIRLSYCCAEQELQKGLDRLEQFLQSL